MSNRIRVPPDREGVRLLRKKGLHAINVAQIGRRLLFERPARISSATVIGACSIGAFSYVGPGCEIRNSHIGRFCSIAANVALGPAEHPLDWLSSHPFQFDGVRYFDEYEEWGVFSSGTNKFNGNSSSTCIGHDVWIGRNAIIRQGVTIGSGSVVAGGAFVNKDVEPYSIVAGVPARFIRYRFDPSIIEKLLNLEWWEWKLQPVDHKIDFSNIDAAIDKISELLSKGLLARFAPVRSFVEKVGDGFEIGDV